MSRFALHHRPSVPTRPRPSRWRLQGSLLLAAIVAAVVAPTANAAIYKVYSCTTPDGAPIGLGKEWRLSQMHNSFAWHSCDQTNGKLSLSVGRDHDLAPIGTNSWAAWKIVMPDSVGLAGVVLRAKVNPRPIPGDNNASPVFQVFTDRKTPSGPRHSFYYRCGAIEDCKLGHPWSDPTSFSNAREWGFTDDTVGASFEVSCEPTGPSTQQCRADAISRLLAELSYIEMWASDVALPTATVAGTALESGVQKGVRTINMTAHDEGSGVARVSVAIDDKEVGSGVDLNGGQCLDAGFSAIREYRTAAPCPSKVPSLMTFDSAQFADGKHTLRVYVEDAAGSKVAVEQREVVFENYPPPANTARPSITGITGEPRPNDVATASVGTWQSVAPVQTSLQWERSRDANAWTEISGATAAKYTIKREDLGFYLRVVVTAKSIEGTTQAVSPPIGPIQTGATVAPAGLNEPTTAEEPAKTGPDPSTAQLVVDREQRTVAVKHGAKIVITGRLVDAEGQPIADADVDVFEQLVLTAAPWTKIGTVKTDSQGGYVFRPQTTASRRLRFAFADKRDAANYRATREVLVDVEGLMTISAKKKVLKPGGMIRLKGRLTIDQLPKTGTWVEIQVLDSGVWRTIATRKTSSKGLWTFKHRLRQSSGITFRFRSRLRSVGDVASAETKSPVLKVRVR